MNNDTAASLATIAAAGLGLFALLWWTTPASPGVCLTKKEARHLWPRQHIYWYSKDHCWSNRRGPPRGIKLDPIDPVFPKSSLAQEPRRRLELDKTSAIEAASASEDYCCWPLLDVDPSGNVIEPPLTWRERWYEFPQVFVLIKP